MELIAVVTTFNIQVKTTSHPFQTAPLQLFEVELVRRGRGYGF